MPVCGGGACAGQREWLRVAVFGVGVGVGMRVRACASAHVCMYVHSQTHECVCDTCVCVCVCVHYKASHIGYRAMQIPGAMKTVLNTADVRYFACRVVGGVCCFVHYH